jgi:hypothetical protein
LAIGPLREPLIGTINAEIGARYRKDATMPENTRTELVTRVVRDTCKAIFVDYFYLTMVATGIALLLLPYLFPRLQGSAVGHVGAHIGDAILIAGAVTTFMRFFASLDIVGERIRGWLESDAYLESLSGRLAKAVYRPDRLKDLTALTEIWRNISLVITRNAFPQIADRVHTKMLERILQASAEYYLDSYSRTTHIRRLTGEKDFVEVEHELRLSLIANQNNQSAQFQARLLLDEFTEGGLAIDYFHVDDSQREVAMEDVAGDRPGVRQYVLRASIAPGRATRVAFAYKFRQSLTKDPYIMWTTTRYVREARHEINFPADSIECVYQDTSFESLLRPDVGCREGRLVYVSKPQELIFPGSAFIFMFRVKER